MKGHEQIVKARLSGFAPKDVFVYIRDANVVAYEDGGDYPDVFTDADSPSTADLRWMYGLTVHLIPGPTTTNEDYAKWWIACTKANPKFLIGIDPDGELNTWN